MLGWSIGFFLAALVAAILGFGGIANAFAGIAQLSFWVFLALLAILLVLSLFGGVAHAGGAVHGGRGFGLLAVALIVGVAVYAWMDNDWSAERAGRSIDRAASDISSDAVEALDKASTRVGTVVEETSSQMRSDLENTSARENQDEDR